MIKNNKAAMFGLDARIALAIFGALSVISGAALYSAIQQAKVTKVITQLEEIGKAVESYYIDTGEELAELDTSRLNSDHLVVTSGLVGWSGPYLSLDYNTTTNKFDINEGTGIGVSYFESSSWGITTPITAGGNLLCDAGDECSIWLGLNDIDMSLANAIDLAVDGVSDHSNGKIRIYRATSPVNLWYKVMTKDN